MPWFLDQKHGKVNTHTNQPSAIWDEGTSIYHRPLTYSLYSFHNGFIRVRQRSVQKPLVLLTLLALARPY